MIIKIIIITRRTRARREEITLLYCRVRFCICSERGTSGDDDAGKIYNTRFKKRMQKYLFQ